MLTTRRSSVWGALALLGIAAVGTAPAIADEPSEAQADIVPLSLDEVLAATQRHFPSILEAVAQRRVAAGETLAAQGNFDLLLSADGQGRLTGFWDGDVATGKVTQPLRPFGASVYGQYQLANGRFPVYEDQSFTNTGGTVKVGVILSLLRDRDIDSRRFAEIDAELALREADIDVLLTRVGVQQQAALAYWNWVAAGRQRVVYEELLKIAQDRDAGLIRQVSSGARAAIFLTENQQNITRRQGLLTAAERDYELAVNRLAFYFRDDEGAPFVPARGRLPENLSPDAAGEQGPPRTLPSVPATIANR
ncbi:MAG: TolC family protein, partial [Pseudomonadota bacterium]